MDMESLLLSQGYFVDTCAAFVIYWESWLMKSGESRRFCRRRGRNSQAKGPFSDSTLESVSLRPGAACEAPPMKQSSSGFRCSNG